MEGILEGIALLKSGDIKITLPMDAGTRLGDLDALRGKKLRITVVEDAAPTETTLTLAEQLKAEIFKLDATRVRIFDIYTQMEYAKEQKAKAQDPTLLHNGETLTFSQLDAMTEDELGLGRTETGEMPDEVPGMTPGKITFVPKTAGEAEGAGE